VNIGKLDGVYLEALEKPNGKASALMLFSGKLVR